MISDAANNAEDEIIFDGIELDEDDVRMLESYSFSSLIIQLSVYLKFNSYMSFPSISD
jgi:hypothetical protein